MTLRNSSLSSLAISSGELERSFTGPGDFSDGLAEAERLCLDTAQIENYTLSSWSKLGSIALQNPGAVISETNFSNDYSQLFLSKLFQTSEVRAAFINQSFPTIGCISFTAVKLSTFMPYCIISLSGNLRTQVLPYIKQCAVEINNSIENEVVNKRHPLPNGSPARYVITRTWEKARIPLYATRMEQKQIPVSIPLGRHCAENDLINELKEEFAQHGESYKVLGNTNFLACPLTPEMEKDMVSKKTLRHRISEKGKVNIGNGFFIGKQGPCGNCRKAKPVSLALMVDAQIRGEDARMNRSRTHSYFLEWKEALTAKQAEEAKARAEADRLEQRRLEAANERARIQEAKAIAARAKADRLEDSLIKSARARVDEIVKERKNLEDHQPRLESKEEKYPARSSRDYRQHDDRREKQQPDQERLERNERPSLLDEGRARQQKRDAERREMRDREEQAAREQREREDRARSRSRAPTPSSFFTPSHSSQRDRSSSRASEKRYANGAAYEKRSRH